MSDNLCELVMLLGLECDTDSDIVKWMNMPTNPRLTTERTVLCAGANIYDPPGYISPFLIRNKLLMQSILLKVFDRDEEFPENLDNKLRNWLTLVKDL